MRPERTSTVHLSICITSIILQKKLQSASVYTCRKVAADDGQKTNIIENCSSVSDTSDVVTTVSTSQLIRDRLKSKRDGGWDGIRRVGFERLQSICKCVGEAKAANGVVLTETSDLLWNKKRQLLV